MKKHINMLLMCLIAFTTTFAGSSYKSSSSSYKSSSSSSWGSKSSSSSSWGSSSSSKPSYSTKSSSSGGLFSSPKSTSTTIKSSKWNSGSNPYEPAYKMTSNPKLNATSKVDGVQTTTTKKASVNNTWGSSTKAPTSSYKPSSTVSNTKTYGTTSYASKPTRKQLYSQNTYTSSYAPKVKPAYIPSTVRYHGHSYPVTYSRFSNGSYGYGYMDPVTKAFIAVAAADMIMDSYDHNNYGYNNSYNRPVQQTVVHREPISAAGAFTVIAVLLIILAFAGWLITRTDKRDN